MSLRGVPSGFEGSLRISPSKATTDATNLARSRIEISSPEPTFTWPSREYIVALRNGGLSLRAICAEMKARGLRAPSGGLVWHVSTLIGIIESHEQLQHIPELPVAAETAVSAGRVVQ